MRETTNRIKTRARRAASSILRANAEVMRSTQMGASAPAPHQR